jgi:hypothetical protein
MLAKGTLQFFPPASFGRKAQEYMILDKAIFDQAAPTGSGQSTINSPNHQLFL